MFYYYFRIFNWISTVFGLKKPFLCSSGYTSKISLLDRLWSLSIMILLLVGYSLSMSMQITDFTIKKNLNTFFKTNNVIINIIVMANNSITGEQTFVNLYETINNILGDLKFSDKTLKMMSIKLYLWILIPTVIYIILMILECCFEYSANYVLLPRIPIYLTIFHLSFHLYLILAILKVLNHNLMKLSLENKVKVVFVSDLEKYSVVKYLFHPDINFIEVNENKNFDLQFLCKMYDSLGTGIQLLQKLHGFQVLLTIWLMFSSAVFGAALIACNQAQIPWLVVVRGLLPFFWCFIACYIDDQLRKEVERTEILIVKYLIDFRCDQSRRNVLQTFKQLVSTSRLQFKASGLFHLSYSMLVGTIMNIITYSIILIQLFLTKYD